MRHTILYITTLVLLFGCKTNQEKTENLSTNEMLVAELDSISAMQLEKLILVPVRNKFKEKYNGYYSYIKTNKGEEILNGEFNFIHLDSSAMYNQALNEYDYSMISVSKIQYSGTFNNGKKDGKFTEKLLFDDGVDLFSKWTVSLDYDDGKCSTGSFIGIFGHIMEETTYQFEQLDSCTFQSVVDKASELWKEEYEKRKN